MEKNNLTTKKDDRLKVELFEFDKSIWTEGLGKVLFLGGCGDNCPDCGNGC